MSNIKMAYDKDPKKHKDAKPIKEATWPEFRNIVGDTWTPGLNVPFDPIASKRAEELGLKVVILDGKDLSNLRKHLRGGKFVGTVINPDK
jgi:uridylate kinase